MDAETRSIAWKNGFVCCFDCETDSAFAQHGGRRSERIEMMQFTCIVVTCVDADLVKRGAGCAQPARRPRAAQPAQPAPASRVDEVLRSAVTRTFWRDEAKDGRTPVHELLELFDAARCIIGYNVLGFDFPLIRRFYRQVKPGQTSLQRYVDHRAKTVDLMHRIVDSTGLYMKLDAVLKENGLPQKSANGLEAIRLWEADERDALQSYCALDVSLTLRLCLSSFLACGGFLLPCKVYGIRSALVAEEASKNPPRMKLDEPFVVINKEDANGSRKSGSKLKP